jgi:hypothetical protein
MFSIIYQSMWVTIFFRKETKDLLSLISLGIEFQRCAPSYTKLFFILLVRGCGKQRLLENWNVSIEVCSLSPHSPLYVKRLVSDLSPILFNNLYMIFSLLFFRFCFKWLPTQCLQYNRMIYSMLLLISKIVQAALFCSFGVFDCVKSLVTVLCQSDALCFLNN